MDFLDVLDGEFVQGIDDLAQVVRSASIHKVFGFAEVTAHAETEDALDLDFEAIDYLFNSVGLS